MLKQILALYKLLQVAILVSGENPLKNNTFLPGCRFFWEKQNWQCK